MIEAVEGLCGQGENAVISTNKMQRNKGAPGRNASTIAVVTLFWFAAAVGPSTAIAQEPSASDDIGLKLGAPPAEGEKKKSSSTPRHRVREGSWLQKNEPIPDPTEVKGSYEAFLDTELKKHYRRLALLDRIFEIANANDDGGLLARTDALRRKEVQRFRRAMKDFRVQAEARRMVGFR